MQNQKIDWKQVNKEMNAQFKIDCRNYGWLALLGELTILTKAVSSYNGQKSTKRDFCPIHGGKKGDKFSLLPKAEENGDGFCFKCWEKVDGIKNVMLSNNMNFQEAVQLIKDVIYPNGKQPYPWEIAGNQNYNEAPNHTKPAPIASFVPPELTDWEMKLAKKRRAEYSKLLNESVGINHDSAKPLRDYFLSRSIDSWGEFGDSLRFHAGVKFSEKVESIDGLRPEELEIRNAKLSFLREHHFYVDEFQTKDGDIYCNMGLHPAAIFIMRNNNTLEATSLQRIYLSNDGKKMELDGHHDITIKKRTASIPGVTSTGSSCHIDSPAMKIIGVAEGPETTLAIRSSIGLPMNCTIDAGGLGNWIPNEETDRVIIFTDKDVSEAGRKAAVKLRERLQSEYIEAMIMEPPLDIPEGDKSIDWQDAVQQLGISAFPAWLVNWEKLDL